MSNRREFMVQITWLAVLPSAIAAFAWQNVRADKAATSSTGDLETLGAAMDKIIPGGDGMPSVTSVGGLQYLQDLAWQYPHFQEEIDHFLRTLAAASAARFRADFVKLSASQQIQVLAEVEKTQASTFATFGGYVYESYYTNPRVLGLLWCDPPPFSTDVDEGLLAPVRKLLHLYREVP